MRMLSVPALAVVLVLLLSAAASAQIGEVVVGGILILRVRADAGGFTAVQRAVLVEQRITEALSRSGRIRVEQVTIRQVGGQPAIFAGDVMIITVDANHARLNGSTQMALAQVWLRNLQEALPRAVPRVAPGMTRPIPSPSPTPTPSPSPSP